MWQREVYLIIMSDDHDKNTSEVLRNQRPSLT